MKRSKIIVTFVITIMILIAIIMFFNVRSFNIVENIRTSESQTEYNNKLLMLVNNKNAIPNNYTPDLIILSNGIYIDEIIYPDLQDMFDTMRENGIYPTVSEGYRTYDEQCQMMQNYIDEYISQGYSQNEAKKLASQWVAKPNYSEHETGLAIDINADKECGTNDTEIYLWLAENAHKFGFILRYPQDKEDITGITYEPWHYRYIGKNDASIIYSKGITLEEYLK